MDELICAALFCVLVVVVAVAVLTVIGVPLPAGAGVLRDAQVVMEGIQNVGPLFGP